MKKVKYLGSLIIFPFLSSCTSENNLVENGLKITGLIILIVAGILFLLGCIQGHIDIKKNRRKYKAKNLSVHDFIPSGDIIAGIPTTNNIIENSLIIATDKKLYFYTVTDYKSFHNMSELPRKLKISIPLEDIKDISIEDKTSIEKKVSLGKIYFLGIYALAWQDKITNEQTMIVLKWRYHDFMNKTIFLIKGDNSISQANKMQNYILSKCIH